MTSTRPAWHADDADLADSVRWDDREVNDLLDDLPGNEPLQIALHDELTELHIKVAEGAHS